MSTNYDRREALKWIGSTVFIGLVGCGGGDGGGDGPHEVPHPDDQSLPDAEATGKSLGGTPRSPGTQQAKENVQYQHSPKGDQYCGNCSLYVPDENGDGFGACAVVAGKIHPCDWCNLYTEYTGEGAVECAKA